MSDFPSFSNRDDIFYSVLQVPKDATPDHILRNYRSIASKLHPDKAADRTDQFLLAEEAKRTLLDPHRRSVYDKYGKTGLDYLDQQLGPKITTLGQLDRELRKITHISKYDWFVKNVHFRGETEVAFILDSLENIEPKSIKLSQKFRVPIPGISRKKFSVNIGAATEASYEGFDYSLLTDIKYSLNNISFFTKIGHGPKFECTLGMKSAILTNTNLTTSFVYNNQYNYWDLHLTNQSVVSFPSRLSFFENLATEFTWILGIYSGIRASITKNTKHYTLSLGTIIYSFYASVYSHYSFMIDKYSWLAYGLRFQLPFSWAITAAAGTNIGKVSKVSLTTEALPKGVTIALGIEWWGQQLRIPIGLTSAFSLEATISSIIYSTCIGWILNALLLHGPRREKELRIVTERKERRDILEKKTSEWLLGQKITLETLRNEEEKKHGLIIVEALYGKVDERRGFIYPGISPKQSADQMFEELPDDITKNPSIISVCDSLQLQVHNSMCHLYGTSKSAIEGFFDPAPDEQLYLEVFYRFHDKLHRVAICDSDELHIPQDSHRF